MADAPEPGSTPDDSPPPIPTPKRGAFPARKSEVENAPPFVPDEGESDDRTDADCDDEARPGSNS